VRRIGRILLALVAAIVIVGIAAWGGLAIYYRAPFGETARQAAGIAFGLLGAAAIIGVFARRVRRATIAFAVAFVLLLVWWSTITPRNDRDWQTDVAVLPYADVQGDLVTMHNVRNFDYRTETDYTPQYYDKTYDLNALDSVDLITSYWMGDAIAHVMLSFGFGGRDYLAMSIETRKERSESYSTLAGFFREYELYYVVADERDVIRVRTDYRKDPPEDVYVYRVKTSPEAIRRLFLSYIDSINSLKVDPEFYNTLTTNCTTTIWMHTKVNEESMPFNWKILVSGYVPQLVYERGRLDTALPFDELRRRAHVNDAARAADTAPDFSQRIRAGIPMPPR